MPDDQITFRTDPRIKARIRELVQRGDYRNTSEFMNQALRLKLRTEGVHTGFEPAMIRRELAAFLDSPEGRRILQEAICGRPPE